MELPSNICLIHNYKLENHNHLSAYLISVSTNFSLVNVFVSQFEVDLMNIFASLMMNDFGDLDGSLWNPQGHRNENSESGIETSYQVGVFVGKLGLRSDSNPTKPIFQGQPATSVDNQYCGCCLLPLTIFNYKEKWQRNSVVSKCFLSISHGYTRLPSRKKPPCHGE